MGELERLEENAKIFLMMSELYPGLVDATNFDEDIIKAKYQEIAKGGKLPSLSWWARVLGISKSTLARKLGAIRIRNRIAEQFPEGSAEWNAAWGMSDAEALKLAGREKDLGRRKGSNAGMIIHCGTFWIFDEHGRLREILTSAYKDY
jgi:hypothetical protein